MPARLLVLLAFSCSLAAAAPALVAPPVAARAYVLVDVLSGQTLAAAAEGERIEPASLTKLMTAYVVFEALREGRLALERPARDSMSMTSG